MTPLVATAQATATQTLVQIPESMRTKCEIWTRVMGYHRPTSQFNIGKKQEAAERKYFVENKLIAKNTKKDDEDDSCCGGDCGGCGSCGK